MLRFVRENRGGPASSGWSRVDLGGGGLNGRDDVHVAEPGEAMEGALEFIAAFSNLGYERAGAYAFETHAHRIIAALLVDPNSRSLAAVTDAVISVTNRFEHRRLLTRNPGFVENPPTVLSSDLLAADPGALHEAHIQRLEMIARRGLRPDVLDPSEVVDMAIGDERAYVEWMVANKPSVSVRGIGKGGIWEDHRRADVERWMQVWRALSQPRGRAGRPHKPRAWQVRSL